MLLRFSLDVEVLNVISVQIFFEIPGRYLDSALDPQTRNVINGILPKRLRDLQLTLGLTRSDNFDIRYPRHTHGRVSNPLVIPLIVVEI